MTSHRAAPRFPWRKGNQFTLLVNADAFLPAMLHAISLARKEIQLEMYFVESGHMASNFIQHMLEAAEKGAQIQLLLDDFGSRGFTRADRNRLDQAGIQLLFYNPLHPLRIEQSLFRTHRKLLLIDDQVAFVGGAGISDQFLGKQGWRETMLEIKGPVLADWKQMFQHNWAYWSKQPTPPELAPQPPVRNGLRGRVACNKGETHGEIKRAFLHRQRYARRRLWMATAYFIPSAKARRGLRRAARRGVDVRLILPGAVTDHPAIRFASQRYYARLLRHGVRIYEYQGRFMHTKVTLIDDWVSIGSSNLDRWNLRWNLEANQEIDAVRFARRVEDMLRDDLADCREIGYQQWRRRSRAQRIKEWFWGKLELRLARLYIHSKRTPPPGEK